MVIELTDKLLIEKSYVEISSYRLMVLKTIGTETKTPTMIAKQSGIRTNHISNVLRQLKTHGIVFCLNEEMRKGRLYRLTDLGLQILEAL